MTMGVVLPFAKPEPRSKRNQRCGACGTLDCHRPHAGIACTCRRCTRQRERYEMKRAAFFGARRGPRPAGRQGPKRARRRRRWRLPLGWRSTHRRAWTRTQPCLVRELNSRSECEGMIHAHHAGRKRWGKIKASDQTCVPLCVYHHACWHHASGPFRILGREGRRDWALGAVMRCQAFYAAEHPGRVAGIAPEAMVAA